MQAVAVFIGIIIVVFVVWTVAVAVAKTVAYLVYVVPIVFAGAIFAGAAFAWVSAGWVLTGGGAPPPRVLVPSKVAAGEVFHRKPTGPSKAYGWDWAWPSYLPYQLAEDAKAIYATQIGLVGRYWTMAFDQISTSAIWVRIVAAPLIACGVGLFGASALAVTTLTLALLAIPFACAMTVRWAAIYALRGIDVAYRVMRRSSAKCPNSECYEPTTLPSFDCPNHNCSTVHRDIRPGRLGVLTRRCGCGTAMPTMVIRASVSKLQARCPSCDESLTQGAGSRRTIQMPVFGTANSGKTRFMLAATVAFDIKLRSQGGELTSTDIVSQELLDRGRQLIAQRANTEKTAAALPQAFGLIATPAEGRPVELHLYDAAGELFDTWNQSANLRYLQSAEGLVFVVDPLTTPTTRAALARQGLADSVSVGHGSPSDSYDNAVEYLRAAGANLKQKSLAVVLTKADILFQLPVAGNLAAGDNASVRDWFAEHDLDSLLERIRLDFGSTKYFVVDSLNSVDPASALSPLHPLDWLLRQLKTTVLRPDPVPTSSGQAP